MTDKDVRVVLPKEHFTLLKWKEDGLPCIGMVNSALKNFQHKNIFSWHLSLTITFSETIHEGMPSEKEQSVIDPFCDQLNREIKAGGNALLLARETWNKVRRMEWRVYDPTIADQHLKDLIKYQKHPRPFDYRMDHDIKWEFADWYLRQL